MSALNPSRSEVVTGTDAISVLGRFTECLYWICIHALKKADALENYFCKKFINCLYFWSDSPIYKNTQNKNKIKLSIFK